MLSHNNHQTVLHFRRWSRKRYAAFCSLGRCVNIGVLNCKIADCSLKKQKVQLLSPENSANTVIYSRDTDLPPSIEETEHKSLLFIPISKNTEYYIYYTQFVHSKRSG